MCVRRKKKGPAPPFPMTIPPRFMTQRTLDFTLSKRNARFESEPNRALQKRNPARTNVLPWPSDEQNRVITSLLASESVVCIALAGTGKTTTSLLAAQRLNVKTVLITYNKALQAETNRRILESGLSSHVEAYTFHGLFRTMMKLHDAKTVKIKDDASLNRNLALWRSKRCLPRRIDAEFIGLDEVQDLCPLYYECLCYVMPATPVTMLVVGDPNQTLYDFKGHELKADAAYITDAPKYFGAFTGAQVWRQHALTVSYRLTPNIARFVNKVWGTQIVAGNDRSPNCKVEYWHLGAYDTEKLSQRVSQVLKSEGVQNVLLMSMSVKNGKNAQTPLEKLLNQLQTLTDKHGRRLFNFHIGCEMNGEKQRLTASLVRNKARVWTYCSSKGSEAPVVIVFGFSSFDDARARTMLKQMGVALSRSSRRLIVIHPTSTESCLQGYWPGMNRSTLERLIREQVVEMTYMDDLPNEVRVDPDIKEKALYASDMTQMSPQSFDRMLGALDGESTHLPNARVVNPATESEFVTGALPTTENYSFLYGTAVPLALEFQRTTRIAEVEKLLYSVKIDATRFYSDTDVDQLLQENDLDVDMRQKLLEHLCVHGLASKQFSMKGRDLMCYLNYFPRDIVNASNKKVGVCDKNTHDALFLKFLPTLREVYAEPSKTPAHFMMLANACQAANKSHALWLQIGTDISLYEKWVDRTGFDNALANLHKMTTATEFEVMASKAIIPPFAKNGFRYTKLCARVDAVHEDEVFEFKFKDYTDDTDRAQMLFGSALIAVAENKTVRGKLVNYKTGEIWSRTLTETEAAEFLKVTTTVYQES